MLYANLYNNNNDDKIESGARMIHKQFWMRHAPRLSRTISIVVAAAALLKFILPDSLSRLIIVVSWHWNAKGLSLDGLKSFVSILPVAHIDAYHSVKICLETHLIYKK